MGEAKARGFNKPFKTPGHTGKVGAAMRLSEKLNSQPVYPPDGPASRQARRREAFKASKALERQVRRQVAAAFVKAHRAPRLLMGAGIGGRP